MKTLLLIDAHAMIHRAYHALPSTFKSQDGTPTNAMYGFFMMIQKVVGDFRPTHVVVCFDTPKPTFRKELLKEYQSKRPKMEDTLKVQIPLIREMLTAGGVVCIDQPGFEADDIIGTLATRFEPEVDRILILTGDRDILQLATDKISVIAPKKGVSEFTLFTPDSVLAKLGVRATQIPDYKSLAGDPSDNYHGAPGIGPKTAATLLSQFSSIEELFQNINSVDNPHWAQILTKHKDEVLLLKRIATIVRNVELNLALDDTAFEAFSGNLQQYLKKYELFALMTKLFPQETKKTQPTTQQEHKIEQSDQLSMF